MWTESHQSLRFHPKTNKAVKILGVDRFKLIGHLHGLWWWCLDYAKDGDLSRYSEEQIAEGAGYDGDAIDFVAALVDAGFIDRDWRVHDWQQYGGKILRQRDSNSDRQARFRDRQRSPAKAPADPQRNGYVTVTPDEDVVSNGDVTVMPAHSNGYVTVMPEERNGYVTVTRNGSNALEEKREDQSSSVPDLTHDRDHDHESDRDRDHRAPTRMRKRAVSAHETHARECERAGTIVHLPLHQKTWITFRNNYGKVPPRDLEARWPIYCPDEETWQKIKEGLSFWKKCRQWLADGPDYVTRCETWLAEKLYLQHPEPWHPDQENGHDRTAQPVRRARGNAAPAASWAGDPDDPFWHAEHGEDGLIGEGLLAKKT